MSPPTCSSESVAATALLLAIGPTARAQAPRIRAHPDAHLVEVLAVESGRHPAAVETRVWSACMCDLADEPAHDVLAHALAVARAGSSLPPLLFIADSRPVGATIATLERLAQHLQVAVVVAAMGADSLVDCALLLVSALGSPGLVCFHPEDVATVCGPARVGVAGLIGAEARWREVLRASAIEDVIVVARADATTSLHALDDAVRAVASLLPADASLLFAAPVVEHAGVAAGEIGVIAFHRPCVG